MLMLWLDHDTCTGRAKPRKQPLAELTVVPASTAQLQPDLESVSRAKPLKQPLARLIVVHPDASLLADLEGRLRSYILSEVQPMNPSWCDT